MKCRLCQEDKPLLNSHIIPEFCYKPVYDGKHRLNELSTDPEIKNQCIRQKGIRERLLCKDCEQLISPAEKYVSEFFGTHMVRAISKNQKFVRFHGLDYFKLRLFQLSILWRASVSSSKYFANVALGSHEEVIRNMIFAGNIGESHTYPCIMFSVVTEEDKLNVVDGFIPNPERLEFLPCPVYRFIFSGVAWFYILSKDASWFKYKELLLSKEGQVVIPLIRAEDTDLFTRLGADLHLQGKLSGLI